MLCKLTKPLFYPSLMLIKIERRMRTVIAFPVCAMYVSDGFNDCFKIDNAELCCLAKSVPDFDL